MPVSDPSSSTNLSDRSPTQTDETRSTSETPSTGTRPRSPASFDLPFTSGRIRVPAKRARKAINCAPCRQSKLKCDRERPCSSCRLRGTTTSCHYQGQDVESLPGFRTDVSSDPRSVNPAVEFSKIRQALALLESHVNYIQNSPALSGSSTPSQASFDSSTTLGPSQLKEDLSKSDLSEPEEAPGARGQSSRSGLYAGPTSTVSHLTSGIRDGSSTPEAISNSPEQTLDFLPTHNSDYDLCKELPPASVIDGLVDFYFEYCTWVYRYVSRAFMAAWARYKSGAGADRTVLATVCMIMAVALRYLPAGHELRRSLPPDTEELAKHYYNVMRLALQRKQTEKRSYTVELVELLLVRSHYLMLSKVDNEETWHVKGELVAIATAMGLHRDPGKEMPLEVAERRRWAWWNVVILERWQAFLFGRPIAIASHHFDTRLPSYCHPDVDPSGKLFEVNLHIFRFGFILGNILDDALSLRPVPYESVLAKDRFIQEWWDNLPTELDIDDYTVVNFLSSSTTSKLRIAVQSVALRAACLHVRFAMHRPYASLAHGESSKYATSLKTSINAANKLIELSAHSRPEILNNAALAVSSHLSWGPVHCFSAAMFFCFQIINNPEQAGVRHLRASVLRAMTILESFRGVRVAEKALDILRALGPLYTEEFLSGTPEDRERKKQAVLPAVRKLQFPYFDSPNAPHGSSEVTGSGDDAYADSPQPDPRPDPTPSPHHPSGQGTTVYAQEQEIMSMLPSVSMFQPQRPTYEDQPSLQWAHANPPVGDPARYLGPRQQGHPAAPPPQLQQQQYRLTAEEEEEAMWRRSAAAANHSLTPTSPSRAHYAQQMVQYSPEGDFGPLDGRMGFRVGAEGMLWGATGGFAQGEWDRMYVGLGLGRHVSHEGQAR